MTAFGFGAEEFDEGLNEAVDRARGLLRDLYHLGEQTVSEAAGGFGAPTAGPFGGFGGFGARTAGPFGGHRESAPHPGHGPGPRGGFSAHADPEHGPGGDHGSHGGPGEFGAHEAHAASGPHGGPGDFGPHGKTESRPHPGHGPHGE